MLPLRAKIGQVFSSFILFSLSLADGGLEREYLGRLEEEGDEDGFDEL